MSLFGNYCLIWKLVYLANNWEINPLVLISEYQESNLKCRV